MKALGIIAEYNPFHNGHLYHINKTKEQVEPDVTVAVMSGNFTQRGEAAILDKWERSRLAVDCGVDLVLELPFVYACNSAEYFAKGGIGVLNGLGCVTHLGFGSESGRIEPLQTLAAFLAHENQDFTAILKTSLKKGNSYAKAREESVRTLLGKDVSVLLQTPNNILAIEYLKQLCVTGSDIKPVTVKRYEAGCLDREPVFHMAGASAIRRQIPSDEIRPYVPAIVADALPGPQTEERLFELIRGFLLREPPEALQNVFSVNEGLEYKLKKEVRYAASFEELIAAVKSKRYPETRIRRIMCHVLVGLKPYTDAYYGRVLAFNQKGADLLKRIKKQETAQIPVITNMNKETQLPAIFNYDILATDLYNLAAGRDLYRFSDYVRKPYYKTG